jgi:hypothetical protein
MAAATPVLATAEPHRISNWPLRIAVSVGLAILLGCAVLWMLRVDGREFDRELWNASGAERGES